MSEDTTISEAVSLLQELGLQEYEARCFLALTQLPSATAKEIHEISEVPRTRVYDAIRVLESQGLVEVQHSSPQRYRAVSISEGTRTFRQKYTDRIETLETHLESIKQREMGDEEERIQEVWSLDGHEAINSRTFDLIDGAESEIALLVVDESILSNAFFENIHEAARQDISIILGGQTERITAQLGEEFPNVRVFETGLNWLTGQTTGHEVAISRVLLVDREMLLIGSYYPDAANEMDEQAIYASGLENGIVVLLRRLISSGLAAASDPGV